jgi:hypothetical protein
MSRHRLNNTDRFWSMVDKTSSCWVWQGHPAIDGLGRFSESILISPGKDLIYKTHTAATYAFILRYGRKPKRRLVKLCKTGLCVRIAKEHVAEGYGVLCHPERKRASNGLCESCYQKQRRAIKPAKFLLHHARGEAKRRGIAFRLTEKYILSIWTDVCPVFGLPLRFNDGTRAHDSYSLDRICSSKGYVAGNVQIVSWRANDIKSNATLEELERLVLHMRKMEVS